MAENDQIKTSLHKAMAICATSEHCSDDIRIKLNSWGLKDSDAEKVINTLIKENFINDKRYAEAFVSDKFRQNKWGRLKIAALLRAKRLSQELISSALDSIDKNEYQQVMRETISSHRKVIKAKNRYELKGKLLRYGLSKGFESNLLYDILNEDYD